MGKQYKIYRETNYIRVIDTTTNELFNGTVKDVFVDKSNTQKNIYRLFNVKDLAEDTVFSIPDILKANGSAYSASEWETFYTENTANFNGGGTAPTVNTAFTNKAYSAIMNIAYDSENPNIEIDLTGNLDLTITGTSNGDSGLVNLYFSGTEVATINGIKGLSLTGTGVMIPIYFIHDTDGIKWYDAREAVAQDLSAYPKYIIKDVTPSTPHTGSTAETIIKSYLIPANSFSSSDILNIISSKVQKIGVAGICLYKIYKNTVPNLSGTPIQIAYKSITLNSLYFNISRSFILKDGLIKGMNGSQNAFTDEVETTTTMLSATFDTTIDNYIIITAQLGAGADSIIQQNFIVTN